MKSPTRSDKAVVAEFHKVLHGSEEATYVLLERDGSGVVTGAEKLHGLPEKLYGELKARNEAGCDILLMVNKTDGNGHAARNVVAVTAYAVDLDHGRPSVLNAAALMPHLVVRTSKNRRHAVWRVAEHQPTDQDKVALKALTENFEGDPGFTGISQAVRVPGFINHKHRTRVSLRREPEDPTPYPVEKFNAHFDVALWQRHFEDGHWPVNAERVTEDNVDGLAKSLQAALEHISPDDYFDWINVGFSLKHLDEIGLRLWDEWSKGSDKYDADQVVKKWNSFPSRPRRKPESIFWLARRSGWNPPSTEQHDAQTYLESERTLGRAIARHMRVGYRVVLGEKRARFFKWDGERFVALDERQKRNAVEEEMRAFVAKSASKEDRPSKNALEVLRRNYGTNRAIEALSDSVADAFAAHSVNSLCDRTPYLGCENGVLNLLTAALVDKRLRPFSQYCASVRFDPDAECPRFDLYLDEVFERDQSMKAFVLRLLGYTLLGDPKEHVFIILHGKNGRNGKSKLINVFEAILGEYFLRLPVVSVLSKSHTVETTTPAFAKLRGKRAASFDEVNVQQKLDAGLVKAMTGGDGINARALYGDQQHFQAEFTPFMIANFLPEIRDDDPAMWARVVIVPFNRSFSKEEMDVDLEKKLVAEKSGILNRLLEGAKDYLANGLQPPRSVRDQVQHARFNANAFEVWLQDRCELATTVKTPLQDLLADYRYWRKENQGHRRLDDREVRQRLNDRFEVTKPQNKVHFRGVKLRYPPNEETA